MSLKKKSLFTLTHQKNTACSAPSPGNEIESTDRFRKESCQASRTILGMHQSSGSTLLQPHL